MSEKCVIGLDYGTKSERAVLVRVTDGAVLHVSERNYPHGVMEHVLPDSQTQLGVDWCLEDPADYLFTLEETVREVMKNSGTDPASVIGLSMDFTASTVLPVTKEGTPLCSLPEYGSRPHAYAKLWKHHGAQKQADRICEILKKRNELDLPRYGGRVSPELLIPKALEILEEDEEIYNRMDSFLEAPDWINFLLTGERKYSFNTAGYKAFYTEEDGYPDRSFFRSLDPRMENFIREKHAGSISPVGSLFGRLDEKWAARLGLKSGTAVGTSVIDAHAGIPGCGITEPGKLMMIIGTSAVMASLSEKPYSAYGIIGNVKGGIIPGFYALETGLTAMGDQLDWFVTHCVPAEYASRAAAENMNIHSYLTKLSKDEKPGGNGLIILDWWNGNKTPYVDGNASGVMVGLNMTTSPEEIYRALIESSAYGAREIMEYYERAGVRTDEIMACGGITGKNPLLMQIFSDVTGKKITALRQKQTAAMGAAVYAASAAGEKAGGYGSVREAVKHMIRPECTVYLPDPERHEIYNGLYGNYLRLTDYFNPHENPVMKLLKTLRKH